MDRIDTQRQHLERQLQRLIDAYQQEIITLHDLATRREQITQRLKGSSRNGTVEQQRDTTIKWDRIADNIKQFRTLLGSNLDRLSYEDRKQSSNSWWKKSWCIRTGRSKCITCCPVKNNQWRSIRKKASRVNFMSCDCNTSSVQRFW